MTEKMMRVQRLELTHFRGIRHLTLDFTENVTVLVGVNGAGKTSILEALCVLLVSLHYEVDLEMERHLPGYEKRLLPAPFVPYESQKSQEPMSLQSSDVQAEQENMSLGIQAIVADQPLGWSIHAQSTIAGKLKTNKELQDVTTFTKQLGQQVMTQPQTALPLAIYYAIGRDSLRNFSLLNEERPSNQLSAYKGSLSGGGLASTNQFIDWFRRREDYENEKRIENGAFRDPQLQAVRRAVEEMLPEFGDLRIRRQPMRMVIRKGRIELELRHLSEGELYLLTLGADIARRLALTNPLAEEPRLCSAVILIDEIETHLHPSWQRRVIPALARAFPNCQFIISTHSPQVLSNVKPECIYLLTQEDGELRVLRPEASFGRDSNRILEDIMGVDERPSEIKQRLSDYFYLIDQGRMEEARSLRRELELLIGPDEPEFTRADALMRTRELLSR